MIDALAALGRGGVSRYCCTSCINAGAFPTLSNALAALLYRITIYRVTLGAI